LEIFIKETKKRINRTTRLGKEAWKHGGNVYAKFPVESEDDREEDEPAKYNPGDVRNRKGRFNHVQSTYTIKQATSEETPQEGRRLPCVIWPDATVELSCDVGTGCLFTAPVMSMFCTKIDLGKESRRGEGASGEVQKSTCT
jgi:hypothetical protein